MTAPARRRPGAESPIKLTPQVEEVRTAASVPMQEAAPAVSPQEQPPAPAKTATAKRRKPAAVTTPMPAGDSDATEPATFNLRSVVKKSAETAVLRTQGYPGGYTSMKALVEGALERELARLADEFNGGEPFPPNEGGFRRGRPLGS